MNEIPTNRYRIEYEWLDGDLVRLGWTEFDSDGLDSALVEAEIDYIRHMGRNVLGAIGIWKIIKNENPIHYSN